MAERHQPLAQAHTESREEKQQYRLLVALALLLVALAVVIVKDRDFWFNWNEAEDSTPAPAQIATKVQAPAQNAVAQPAGKSNHVAPKASRASVPTTSAPATANAPADSDAPAVAANRVALPPLDVEVVAGDSHRLVHPGSNATKVEIPGQATRLIADLPKNAAAHEGISSSAAELQQTVAVYPALGDRSRVQGSVVLQAVIGADGNIENIHVLSGPAILIGAAQQAVREWRFKPYVQNGQPVETKARITVNFSIKVADTKAS
ncbi:MAG TPA: TonB family protein [Candidatus Binatia bacterium]|nr:TonB family protein [Candidatus Binatia bacterium]